MLTTLLLGLGVSMIVFILLVSKQVEKAFQHNAKGINLVLGAKGSPLQLVLCNVYHIDVPTGNIPLKEAQKIAQNKQFVKKAIPISLGDNYAGYRIVGTTTDYLSLFEAKILQGRTFSKPLEALLGAGVAQELDLKIGSQFVGSHGLNAEGSHAHEEMKYTVVGILQKSGSVIDKLILTPLESIWKVHDTHPTTASLKEDYDHENCDHNHEEIAEDKREITAMLIQAKNPLAMLNLPRKVNAETNMQMASPAAEITRLFSLLGIGIDLVRILALILISIAGLSIFISLFNALKERKYDLALMRGLGVSKHKLVGQMLLEGIFLAMLGLITGLLLGHIAVAQTGIWLAQQGQIPLTGFVFFLEEYAVIGFTLAVGILSALIPALRVYRISVAHVLAER
ncbi:MAG: ABC transporter permease [Microscillaceae bacterium]|nr:ABC transporter permease [Microscillaceae bacterium]MDW8461605.1 ABC transporter permease [Cytophagales bacterium]